MGTRINVLLNHQIDDYQDRELLLNRLSQALPEAVAVEGYWSGATDCSPLVGSQSPQWTANPYREGFTHYSYTGPGSLYVSIIAGVAWIRTGGRWRGFLSIPSLRRVHLDAFRAIATALGATTMICFPDNDALFDMFWDGEPLKAFIRNLEETVGPPQPSIEAISAQIIADTEKGVPDVWFTDNLPAPENR